MALCCRVIPMSLVISTLMSISMSTSTLMEIQSKHSKALLSSSLLWRQQGGAIIGISALQKKYYHHSVIKYVMSNNMHLKIYCASHISNRRKYISLNLLCFLNGRSNIICSQKKENLYWRTDDISQSWRRVHMKKYIHWDPGVKRQKDYQHKCTIWVWRYWASHSYVCENLQILHYSANKILWKAHLAIRSKPSNWDFEVKIASKKRFLKF